MIIQSNGLENLMNLLSRTYIPSEKDPAQCERIRRGSLIIRILDLMLKKMDKKYFFHYLNYRNVYPVSKVRAFCEEPHHLAPIIQILIIENTELRKKTMKFIGNYFVYQQLSIKNTGIIDFLINSIDSKTGNEAFNLLYKIQASTEDYNSDLDFTVFSQTDKELIKNNDKIKNSVFLRYLPVPFVKFLTEDSNRENVFKTFLEAEISEPALIWSKDMRGLLFANMENHLAEFKEKLKMFVKNKTEKFRIVSNMPIYNKLFNKIIKYPQIEKEIRCGEYYLRIWNKNKIKMENVQQVIFMNNLEITFSEITQDFEKINLEDLQIVLKSYTIAYLKYHIHSLNLKNSFNKKGNFGGFNMLLRVIQNISKTINNEMSQLYAKNILKFIYRIVFFAWVYR